MTKSLPLLAAAVLTLASAAEAQPGGRRGAATLYDQPNFEGNAVTITQSTPDLGKWRFNDRAQSGRFEGRWLICEHDDFKGRCQQVSGAVPNLHAYGLMAQMSSLEPADRPGPGPGPGGGYPGPGGGYPGPGGGNIGPRGIEGVRTVFFPRPTLGGADLAAGDRGADAHCRRHGLGPSVWFDSSERSNRAVGPEGQFVGRSPVIRDLLCRKY